jgi:uncharacterized protein (DUF927 family)
MGIIENLHGLVNSAALIETLVQGYRPYHGAVGREWLRRLVADRKAVAPALQDNVEAVTVELLNGVEAGGQVRRVARRFALAAVAGDLANRYGLTPWAEDETVSAAKTCFSAWLEVYGGAGNREQRMLIEQVRAFLEAHGASRFEPHDRLPEDSGRRPVINRVGFTRPDNNGNAQYLVLREAFRSEVVKGFDPRWAAVVLKERGLLLCEPPNLTCKVRIRALADKGATRVYLLAAAALGIENAT